jgi:hypothetical protein
MAIQPTTRIAGSSHILRFQGSLVTGTSPQTQNATVLPAAAANTPTFVAFALADMTNVSDRTKKLPDRVYDNSVPAGATRPPSLTTAGGPSGASGTGAPSGTTWQQNIRIRAQEASASTAAPLIARIDVLNPKAIYDTATSGLQQNTGTPVVACDFYFTAAGIAALAAAGVPVIVEVEVPYTVMR